MWKITSHENDIGVAPLPERWVIEAGFVSDFDDILQFCEYEYKPLLLREVQQVQQSQF